MAKTQAVKSNKAVNGATIMHKARLGRKPIDPNETKAQKFERLCGVRLTKALKLLKGMRNCSNTAVYEYTPKHVQYMLGRLRKSIDLLEQAYKAPSNGAKKPYTVAKVRSAFEGM